MNGKVERSHRVDNEELYQLLDKDGVSDDRRFGTTRFASAHEVSQTAVIDVVARADPRVRPLGSR